MSNQVQSNKVFVVHGHNDAMKQAVARTLEKLGLTPIILHEQPNQGKTIIEKFENYADVGFAVVILSADDKGFAISQKARSARPRPRQNVILELGYFLAKLGRDKVMPLYEPVEKMELPSDYDGVVFVPYDQGGNWRFDLVRELNAVGYDVDANALLNVGAKSPTTKV